MHTVISIGNQPQKHQCNLQKHLRDQDPWNQGKHSLRRLPFKTSSTENPNDLPMTFKVVQGHKSWHKYVKLGGGYKSLKDLTSPFTYICWGRKDTSYLHISAPPPPPPPPPPEVKVSEVIWMSEAGNKYYTYRYVCVCVRACVCVYHHTTSDIYNIYSAHTKNHNVSISAMDGCTGARLTQHWWLHRHFFLRPAERCFQRRDK